MTRELNVRITLEQHHKDEPPINFSDKDLEFFFEDALRNAIDEYYYYYSTANVEVQIETVKPESEKK